MYHRAFLSLYFLLRYNLWKVHKSCMKCMAYLVFTHICTNTQIKIQNTSSTLKVSLGLHPSQGTVLISHHFRLVMLLHINRMVQNVFFCIYFHIKHYICENYPYCYMQQPAISSFPLMISIPLYGHIKICLSILEFIHIWIVSSCGLFGIKLV